MKPEHHIAKPTILVVDDQPEQLGALFAELQLNGYSLQVSRNSAETFKILTRFQPDIILLDVKLPDTDGFEVCLRLKRDEELCNIPVLRRSFQGIRLARRKPIPTIWAGPWRGSNGGISPTYWN